MAKISERDIEKLAKIPESYSDREIVIKAIQDFGYFKYCIIKNKMICVFNSSGKHCFTFCFDNSEKMTSGEAAAVSHCSRRCSGVKKEILKRRAESKEVKNINGLGYGHHCKIDFGENNDSDYPCDFENVKNYIEKLIVETTMFQSFDLEIKHLNSISKLIFRDINVDFVFIFIFDKYERLKEYEIFKNHNLSNSDEQLVKTMKEIFNKCCNNYYRNQTTEGENDMAGSETNTMVNTLIEGLKAVQVVFEGSTKHYTYKTLDDYEMGDQCLVDSPHHGLVVVEVVGLDQEALELPQAYKWVVQKIDLSQYQKAVEQEQQMRKKLNEMIMKQKNKTSLEKLKDMIGEDGYKQLSSDAADMVKSISVDKS